MSGHRKGGKGHFDDPFVLCSICRLRVLARVVPNVIARFFEITSRVCVLPTLSLIITTSSCHRYHETHYSSSCSSSCSSRRCQTYLRFNLWRDMWCPQDLPRECESPFCLVFLAHVTFWSQVIHDSVTYTEQDGHGPWCCICSKRSGRTLTVLVHRIILFV